MHAQRPTFTAQIYMAGDIGHAKQIIRQFCSAVGLCVTVEPVDYIYTGGEESGFRVGFIDYPKFPAEPGSISSLAFQLANELRRNLGQHSFSIVTPTETTWDTTRDDQSASR